MYLTGMFLPGLCRCAIFYEVLRERRKMYWLLAVMSNLPGWGGRYVWGRLRSCRCGRRRCPRDLRRNRSNRL